MELMCRLAGQKPYGAKLAIAVLGCSKGAEVYSFLWSLRKVRPDLKITLQAVDISQDIVDFAKEGAYSLRGPAGLKTLNQLDMTEEEKLFWLTYKDQGFNQSESIFQRMESSEIDAMFDRNGDQVKVKPWLAEGIIWRLGDATAPELIHALGPQDIVVANRFLCHMEAAAAESCLRNVGRLVKPGGYLFVSGVDLDVRIKVAKDAGWNPVSDLAREIHEGDFSLAKGWPFEWWGLEPFCEQGPDWRFRYSSVFRVGETPISKRDHASVHLLESST